MNKLTAFITFLCLFALASAEDNFLAVDDFQPDYDLDANFQEDSYPIFDTFTMNSEENNEFAFTGENAESYWISENSEEAIVPPVIPQPSEPTDGVVLVDYSNFSTVEYEYQAEGAEVIEDGDQGAINNSRVLSEEEEGDDRRRFRY